MAKQTEKTKANRQKGLTLSEQAIEDANKSDRFFNYLLSGVSVSPGTSIIENRKIREDFLGKKGKELQKKTVSELGKQLKFVFAMRSILQTLLLIFDSFLKYAPVAAATLFFYSWLQKVSPPQSEIIIPLIVVIYFVFVVVRICFKAMDLNLNAEEKEITYLLDTKKKQ